MSAVSDDDLIEWAMNVRLECSMEREPCAAIGGSVLDLRVLDTLLHEIAEHRGLYEPPAPKLKASAIGDLRTAVGQLRHAYTHCINETVGDRKDFGRGLISPAIRRIEGAIATLEGE